MTPRTWTQSALACVALSLPSRVLAAELGASDASPGATRTARDEAPTFAYAYRAAGGQRGGVGGAAYGLGLGGGPRPIAGGGVSVWGSPLERLTLVGDARRDVFGRFAPSAAILVRLVGAGGANGGWSLGALAKYKVEGFGGGPRGDEIEGEAETGLLLSYARSGFHLDANGIAGAGVGDDGEVDAEGRLRLGYDLTRAARFGIDGQARVRLAGATRLPGERTWDFACGPQLVVGSQSAFGALTAGPSTMGLVRGPIGWSAFVTVGGMAF